MGPWTTKYKVIRSSMHHLWLPCYYQPKEKQIAGVRYKVVGSECKFLGVELLQLSAGKGSTSQDGHGKPYLGWFLDDSRTIIRFSNYRICRMRK